MHVHFVLRSRNEKTGPIPVSTTSSDTCPESCPLRGSGCYAESGPLAMHWQKVSAGTRGDSWIEFCRRIAALPAGQLWRHNQAGDLPGRGDTIDVWALGALVKANASRRGFTYTHKPISNRANRAAIARANKAGLTVNLSANSPAHADSLLAAGIGPVVTVLPADVDGAKTPVLTSPAGNKIPVCPATYRDDVTCKSCQLCARPQRKSIVGFPAHGSGKHKASAIASAG